MSPEGTTFREHDGLRNVQLSWKGARIVAALYASFRETCLFWCRDKPKREWPYRLRCPCFDNKDEHVRIGRRKYRRNPRIERPANSRRRPIFVELSVEGSPAGSVGADDLVGLFRGCGREEFFLEGFAV